MVDIDWNSRLTPREEKALEGLDVKSLSRFYQKLLANVRIQKEMLEGLTARFNSYKGLKCGGITKVDSGLPDERGTKLTFTFEGRTIGTEIVIPRGDDFTSTAPGINRISCNADKNANGGYDYSIAYGTSASVTVSTAKGTDGKNGEADDGTKYYDNGAVKKKNSVTGLSISGPSLIKASITGMSVGATGISLSLFGISMVGVALYNSSSIKTATGYITNKYPKGAYLRMRSA